MENIWNINVRIKHYFLLSSSNVALLLVVISVVDLKMEIKTQLVHYKLQFKRGIPILKLQIQI